MQRSGRDTIVTRRAPFAVNPSRLPARPSGLRELTARRGQAKEPPCPQCRTAPSRGPLEAKKEKNAIAEKLLDTRDPHISWLDLAESELGVLSSQCLDRRIADKHTLSDEIAAWEQDRNANHAKADWQFTTDNARIKLKHLYPSI